MTTAAYRVPRYFGGKNPGRITVGKEVARFVRYERIGAVIQKRIVSVRATGTVIQRYRRNGVLGRWLPARNYARENAVREARREYGDMGFKEVQI